MLELNAKTALVVIDLQEGILLPAARIPLTVWSAVPPAWRKNAVPAVHLLSWFASVGLRISPKR
jgi:nicotinamidase-related amidase